MIELNKEYFVLKILIALSLLCTNAFSQDEIEVSAMNVKMTSALDLGESGIKTNRGNDIWGWTDPETGKEYAIMGLKNKTSFVDISDPSNPVHLADVKTRTYGSNWRDIKIYQNYAYIVSEAWRHGMQIFDLTRLRDLDGKEVKVLSSDKDYKKFGNAHNIFINEDTGYAYAVGTKTCDGGLHIMNIKDNPLDPQFVTCVGRGIYEVPRKDGDAYTHDVQCVVYNGPDVRYLGKEICVSSNEDTVNIVDVTDKSKPYQISVASYDNVRYTHQGWLTEDHAYFLLGDELDEQKYNYNTRTFIWDFTDLQNPKNFAIYEAPTKAIDHNMYVKGNYVYQANYNAGMRILDISDIANGKLTEVAYLDTMPGVDSAVFEGVWSVFPYFESGTVVVSGINGVLYIAQPTLK